MKAVSIRSLCEFSDRQGDIDYRYTPAPSAQQGIEGHLKLQRTRPASYQPEYSVSAICQGLELRGRADGYDAERHCVEEIKTFRGSLDYQNPGQRALHWAQLRSYGAMIGRQQQLTRINLRLTYLEISSEETCEFTAEVDVDTLWQELETRAAHYHAWFSQLSAARDARNRALQSARFAYREFRQGQRLLAETVYKSAVTGRSLLAEAPTGLGKTLGTLFPALKAMAKLGSDNILYLTTRNTARRLALDAITQIREAQIEPLALRVVELSALESSCVHPELQCRADSCPLAKGFFDRLPEARAAAFSHAGDNLDLAALSELAERHHLCPYYLSQEMARWADIVIADINQYLAPTALLYGFLIQDNWRTQALIDESHNLVERGRDLYSTELQQSDFQEQPGADEALNRALRRVQRAWQKLLKGEPQQFERFSDQLPETLHRALHKLIPVLNDALATQPEQPELQQLLFIASAYLKLAESFAGHSRVRLRRERRAQAELALLNLIPAPFLRERWTALHSLVLFSATLRPSEYFIDLLGLSDQTLTLTAPSPFIADQLVLCIARSIDTRYAQRANSCQPIARLLIQTFQQRPGNYLFFASSFSYLQAIAAQIERLEPDLPLHLQTSGMSAAARQAYLDAFQPGGQLLGMAVLGGLFSEGIDLPGERLIGVAIATLGLPPFDSFAEQLRAQLEADYRRGYDYAYLYPGLQRVIQAAGRLIRSSDDRGRLLLIDRRFARAEIRALFPDWWPEPRFI